MTRTIVDNEEFLVEDAEGVTFLVAANTSGLTLARRFTEKKTGRIFYVDRDSSQVFESIHGGLSKIKDAALLQRLDKQRS